LADLGDTYSTLITNSDGISQEERNAILDILRDHLPLTDSDGIPVAPASSNLEEKYSDDSTPSMPKNDSLKDDVIRFTSHVIDGSRLYDYINTTRRLINRFTLLFHMANSLAEYHLKEGYEILDSSISAGDKQELARSRNDAQKVRKKIATSINKWQEKVGSSVQEISGEITSLVQNKNRANYEQAKLNVELFANESVLEGIGSGIVDGFTHAFSFVRSRVRNQVNGIFSHVMTANTNEMADMMDHYLDGSDTTYQTGSKQGRRIDSGLSLWGDLGSGDSEYDDITNKKNQYTGAYFGKDMWDLIEGNDNVATSPTEKLNIRLLIRDLKNDTARLEALVDRGLRTGPENINIYGMAQGVSQNNVDLISGQNATKTPTVATKFFSSSRDQDYEFTNSTFIDINLSKLEEFRNYMTIFENMLRKALILKQTIMEKKQDEAEKISGVEGTSSSKSIASATDQALNMEIDKLSGSFDQMYSQFLEMHSSVTDFTKAQIQYYKDYRYLIAKNAKNAAHIATLAGATASGVALGAAFAVTGSHLALPTYWSFAINQLGASIIEASYATWEYYDLEVNTPEWNRPVIMQEGTSPGTNHYSHLWTQRYINQAADITEGIAANPKKLYAFTDNEQKYYENKFTAQLMSARNTINKLHSDGDSYGDFTLNYGVGETNHSEIVKGAPEFATNRGDGAITIESTELATKNPELTTHFNVLRAFMSILASYYDAIEGVWSAMFNIQKSGSMNKFGSQFEAIIQQEQGIIGSLKQEISIFQQAAMQNFDKDKSIYTKFYDSLMTQLDIPASLLAFLPPGGRDAAILAKETATESLRMIILENFGDYAGQWSNYKRTEGAFAYDPNEFTGLYSNALYTDQSEQDKLKADSDYQMYTVNEENPNPFSILRDPITGEQISQSALTVGQRTLRQEGIPYWKVSPTDTIRDAYQIAPWHKIEYEERATLQKLLTQGTRRSNTDVLLFREINYAQVIDTQQELLRIATIRSMLMMIEKTLYNAKLTTLRKSYGAASSAGVIDALMKLSDSFSSAQNQEMGDLVQEMGNRVEAHTTWYSSIINTSVAATGLMAFLGIALAQANTSTGDTNSMRKIFRDNIKSGQRAFAKGIATSVSKLVIGLIGLSTLKPAPQTSSQLLAYDEAEDEEAVNLTKRKEELEKEKQENGGTLDSNKQTELDQANVRLSQLEENKTERGKINIDQGNLQFTGRGRLSINKGLLTRAQTKFKQKLRGLKLRREMNLAVSDAQLEAAGEISGEQASGSHRGIMSVLNKFGSSEQGIMDSVFKGVSARATAFNRAMDHMKDGATSFITTSVSKIIQNKIVKADKSAKLKNTQAKGAGNSPGAKSLTKAAKKAHKRKQLLEAISSQTTPVLYLLLDSILNSATEKTFSLSSTEEEDITVSEEGTEFDDDSQPDGFGDDTDGYSGFNTSSLENESLRDSLIAGNVDVRRTELLADKETHQFFANYFANKLKETFNPKDSLTEKDSSGFGRIFGNKQFKKAKLNKFKNYTAGKFDPTQDDSLSQFKRADDSIKSIKYLPLNSPAQNETGAGQAGRYALNAIKFLINIGLIPLAAIYQLPQMMMAQQRKYAIREQGFDDSLSTDAQTRKVMEGYAAEYRRKDAQKQFNKGIRLTEFDEMGVDRRLDLMDAYSGFEDTEEKLDTDSDFKKLNAEKRDQIQKELIALKSTTSFILGREDADNAKTSDRLSLLFNTNMSTDDAKALASQLKSIIDKETPNSKFKTKFFSKKNNNKLKESIETTDSVQNLLLAINEGSRPEDAIDTKFILNQVHALAASNTGTDELIRRHESLSKLLLDAGLSSGLIASLNSSFDTDSGSGSSGRDASDAFNESEKAFKEREKEHAKIAQLALIQDQITRLTESRNFFESSTHQMTIDDKGELKTGKPAADTLDTFTPVKLAVIDPTTGLATDQTVTLFISQTINLPMNADTTLLSDATLKSTLNSHLGHVGDELDFELITNLPEEKEINPQILIDSTRRRKITQYANDMTAYDTQLSSLKPKYDELHAQQDKRQSILEKLTALPEIDEQTHQTIYTAMKENSPLIQRVRNEFGDTILPGLFPEIKSTRDAIKNPDGKGEIYHTLRKLKKESYLTERALTAEDELEVDQELERIIDGRPHALSEKTIDYLAIKANLRALTASSVDTSGNRVDPLLILEHRQLSLDLTDLESTIDSSLETTYDTLTKKRTDTASILDILSKEDQEAIARPSQPEKTKPAVNLSSLYQQRSGLLSADESKEPLRDPKRAEFLEHYLKHAGLGFNRLMAKKRSLDLIGASVEATRNFKLDKNGTKVAITPEEKAAYKLKADQLSQQLENFGGFSLSFGSQLEGLIKDSAHAEKMTSDTISDTISDGYHSINSSLKEVLKKLTKGDLTTTRAADQLGGHHYLDSISDMANDPETYGIDVMSAQDARTQSVEGIENLTGLLGGGMLALLPAIASLAPRLLGLITSGFGVVPNRLSNGLHNAASTMVEKPFYFGTQIGDIARKGRDVVLRETIGDAIQNKDTRQAIQADRAGVNRQDAANSIVDSISHSGRDGASGKPSRINRHRGHELANQLNKAYKVDFRNNVDYEAAYYLAIERTGSAIIHRNSGTTEDMAEIFLHLLDKISDPKRAAKIGAHIFQKASIENPTVGKKLMEALTETAKRTDDGLPSKKYLKLAATSLFEAGIYDERHLFGHLNKKLNIDGKPIHQSSDSLTKKGMRLLGQTIGLPGVPGYIYASRSHKDAVLEGLEMGKSVSAFKHDHALKGIANLDSDTLETLTQGLSGNDLRKGPLRHLLNDSNSMERIVKSINDAGLSEEEKSKRLNALASLYTKAGLNQSPHIPASLKGEVDIRGSKTTTLLNSFDEIGRGDIPGVKYSDFIQNGETLSQVVNNTLRTDKYSEEFIPETHLTREDVQADVHEKATQRRLNRLGKEELQNHIETIADLLTTADSVDEIQNFLSLLDESGPSGDEIIANLGRYLGNATAKQTKHLALLLEQVESPKASRLKELMLDERNRLAATASLQRDREIFLKKEDHRFIESLQSLNELDDEHFETFLQDDRQLNAVTKAIGRGLSMQLDIANQGLIQIARRLQTTPALRDRFGESLAKQLITMQKRLKNGYEAIQLSKIKTNLEEKAKRMNYEKDFASFLNKLDYAYRVQQAIPSLDAFLGKAVSTDEQVRTIDTHSSRYGIDATGSFLQKAATHDPTATAFLFSDLNRVNPTLSNALLDSMTNHTTPDLSQNDLIAMQDFYTSVATNTLILLSHIPAGRLSIQLRTKLGSKKINGEIPLEAEDVEDILNELDDKSLVDVLAPEEITLLNQAKSFMRAKDAFVLTETIIRSIGQSSAHSLHTRSFSSDSKSSLMALLIDPDAFNDNLEGSFSPSEKIKTQAAKFKTTQLDKLLEEIQKQIAIGTDRTASPQLRTIQRAKQARLSKIATALTLLKEGTAIPAKFYKTNPVLFKKLIDAKAIIQKSAEPPIKYDIAPDSEKLIRDVIELHHKDTIFAHLESVYSLADGPFAFTDLPIGWKDSQLLNDLVHRDVFEMNPDKTYKSGPNIANLETELESILIHQNESYTQDLLSNSPHSLLDHNGSVLSPDMRQAINQLTDFAGLSSDNVPLATVNRTILNVLSKTTSSQLIAFLGSTNGLNLIQQALLSPGDLTLKLDIIQHLNYLETTDATDLIKIAHPFYFQKAQNEYAEQEGLPTPTVETPLTDTILEDLNSKQLQDRLKEIIDTVKNELPTLREPILSVIESTTTTLTANSAQDTSIQDIAAKLKQSIKKDILDSQNERLSTATPANVQALQNYHRLIETEIKNRTQIEALTTESEDITFLKDEWVAALTPVLPDNDPLLTDIKSATSTSALLNVIYSAPYTKLSPLLKEKTAPQPGDTPEQREDHNQDSKNLIELDAISRSHFRYHQTTVKNILSNHAGTRSLNTIADGLSPHITTPRFKDNPEFKDLLKNRIHKAINPIIALDDDNRDIISRTIDALLDDLIESNDLDETHIDGLMESLCTDLTPILSLQGLSSTDQQRVISQLEKTIETERNRRVLHPQFEGLPDQIEDIRVKLGEIGYTSQQKEIFIKDLVNALERPHPTIDDLTHLTPDDLKRRGHRPLSFRSPEDETIFNLIKSAAKGASLLKTVSLLASVSETFDTEKEEMVSALTVRNGSVVLNERQQATLTDILLSEDTEETKLAVSIYKKQHPKAYLQLLTALSNDLMINPAPSLQGMDESSSELSLSDIHLDEPTTPSLEQIELALSGSPLLSWFHENEYEDIQPILIDTDLFKTTTLSSSQSKRLPFPSDAQIEHSVTGFFNFGLASSSSPGKKRYPEDAQLILNAKLSQLRTINYDFTAFSRLILQSSESVNIESIENLKSLRQLLGPEDIQSNLMANLQTLIQKLEARKFGLYDKIHVLSQKVLKNTSKGQAYSAELKNIHGLLFAHKDELRDIGITDEDIKKLGHRFTNPQKQLLLTIQLLETIEKGPKEKSGGLNIDPSNGQLIKQVNQARQALSSAAIHELIVNPDTSFSPLEELIPDFLTSLTGLGTAANNPLLNGLTTALADPERVDRLFTLYTHVPSDKRDALISDAFIQAGIFKEENAMSLETVMTYLSHDPILIANLIEQAPLPAQIRLLNQTVDTSKLNRALPFAGQPSGLDKAIQLLGFIKTPQSLWETLSFLPDDLSDDLDLMTYIYIGLSTQTSKDSFRAYLSANLSEEDMFDMLEKENSIKTEASIAVSLSLSPESIKQLALKNDLIDAEDTSSITEAEVDIASLIDTPLDDSDTTIANNIISHVMHKKDTPAFKFYLKALQSLDTPLKNTCLTEMARECSNPANREQSIPVLETVLKTSNTSQLVEKVLANTLTNYPESLNDTLNVLLRNPLIRPNVLNSLTPALTKAIQERIRSQSLLSPETVTLLLSKSKTNAFRTTLLQTSPIALSANEKQKLHSLGLLDDENVYHTGIHSQSELQTRLTRSGTFNATEIKEITLDWMTGIDALAPPILAERLREQPSLFQSLSTEKSISILTSFSNSGHLKVIRPYFLSQPTALTHVITTGFEDDKGSDAWTSSLSILTHLGQRPQAVLDLINNSLTQIEATVGNPDRQAKIEAIIRDTIGSPSFLRHSKNRGRAIEKLITHVGESDQISPQSKQRIADTFASLANSTTSIDGLPITFESIRSLLNIVADDDLVHSVQNTLKPFIENDSLKRKLTISDVDAIEKKLKTDPLLTQTQIDDVLQFLKQRAKRTGVLKETKIRLAQHLIRNGLGTSPPNDLTTSTILSTLAHTGDIPTDLSAYTTRLNDPQTHLEFIEKLTKIGGNYPLMFDQLIQHKDLKHLIEKPLAPVELHKAPLLLALTSEDILPRDVIAKVIDSWFSILEDDSMVTRSSTIPPSYALNTTNEPILKHAFYKAILKHEDINTDGLTHDALADKLAELRMLNDANTAFSIVTDTPGLSSATYQNDLQDLLTDGIHQSTSSMSELTAIHFIQKNLEPRPIDQGLMSTLTDLSTPTDSQEKIKLKATLTAFIRSNPYTILGQPVSATFGPFKALNLQKNPDTVVLAEVIANSQPMIQKTIVDSRIKKAMISIAAEWTINRDSSVHAPHLFDTTIVDANGKLNEKYLSSTGDLLGDALRQDIQVALSVTDGPAISEALDALKQSYLIALLEHRAKNNHPIFASKSDLKNYLTTEQDYEEGPDLDDLLTSLEPLIVYAHLLVDLPNNSDYLTTDEATEAALLSWGIADSTPQTQQLITYTRELFETTHRLSNDVNVEGNYLSSNDTLEAHIRTTFPSITPDERAQLTRQIRPLKALQSLRAELTVSGTFTSHSKETLEELQRLREAAKGTENTDLRESYDTLLETVSIKSISNLPSIINEIKKSEGERDLLWLDSQLGTLYKSNKSRTELLKTFAYGQESLTPPIPPLSWASTETIKFLLHVKQGESRNRLEQLIGSGNLSEATKDNTSIEESMAKQKIIDTLYQELLQETLVEPDVWLKRVESIASYLDEEKIDALLSIYTRNLTTDSLTWTEKHETLVTNIANSTLLKNLETNGKKDLRLTMLRSVMEINNGQFTVPLLSTLKKHDETTRANHLFPQLMNDSLRTNNELYLTKKTAERQFLKKLISDDIEQDRGFLSNTDILDAGTSSILADVFGTVMKSRNSQLLRRKNLTSHKNRFTDLYSKSLTDDNQPLQYVLQKFIRHLSTRNHDLTWFFDEITDYTATRSKNNTDETVTFAGLSKKEISFWKKHLTEGKSPTIDSFSIENAPPLLSKTGEPLARIDTTITSESLVRWARDIAITLSKPDSDRLIRLLKRQPNELITATDKLNHSIADDLLLQKMTDSLRTIGISTDTTKLQKMSKKLVNHLKMMPVIEKQFQLALAEEGKKTFDVSTNDGIVIQSPRSTDPSIIHDKNLGEIMGILKENGLIKNGQIIFPLPETIATIDWKNSDLDETQQNWVLATLKAKTTKMKTALQSLNQSCPEVLYRYDESHMNGNNVLLPYLHSKHASQLLSAEHMLYDIMQDRLTLSVSALSSAPNDYEKRQLITTEEATSIFETLKKSDIVDKDLLVIPGNINWTHLSSILKTVTTTNPSTGETTTIKLSTKQLRKVHADLNTITEHALGIKDRLLTRPTQSHIEYFTTPNLSKKAKAFYIQMMMQKPVLQSKSLTEQNRNQSQVAERVIKETLRQAAINQTNVSIIEDELETAEHRSDKIYLETKLESLKQKQKMLNEAILNLYTENRPQFQDLTTTPELAKALTDIDLKMLLSKPMQTINEGHRLTGLGVANTDVLRDDVSETREALIAISQSPDAESILTELTVDFLTIMLAANSLIKQGLATSELLEKITATYQTHPDLLTKHIENTSTKNLDLAFALPDLTSVLTPLNARYETYKHLKESCTKSDFFDAPHNLEFIQSLFYKNEAFDSDSLDSFIKTLPFTNPPFNADESYKDVMTGFAGTYPELIYQLNPADFDSATDPSTDINETVEQALIDQGYLTFDKSPTDQWTATSDLSDILGLLIPEANRADISLDLLTIYRHKHKAHLRLTLAVLTDLGTVIEKQKENIVPTKKWLVSLSNLFKYEDTAFIQHHIERLNLKDKINDAIDARFGPSYRLTYFNETEIATRLKSIERLRDPGLIEEQVNLGTLNTIAITKAITEARNQFSRDGNLLTFLQTMVTITAKPKITASVSTDDLGSHPSQRLSSLSSSKHTPTPRSDHERRIEWLNLITSK
ncbi:hypothetical protein HOH45_04770, partial [bacterium]|nr:hypothetical protein [bacterium]